MTGFLTAFGGLGVVFIALIVIGVVLMKCYRLSTKDRAFIRTGLGSEKIVMSGGAFVLPRMHEVTWVNMRTLKLEVRREKKDSLLAGDKMRVDVTAEFYVRVKADAEGIATAAEKLGDMTLDLDALRQQIEPKFVDALRAVAARMPMHELHEKRSEFGLEVRKAVADDLLKNGLELESVSLTSLNQTDKQYFDANNAFDAEGLAQLIKQTEQRRKETNAIEQDTQVAIAEKNLTATEQTLKLDRQRAEAQLAQQREIETMTANQQAEIASVKASGRQRAETADLDAELAISQARIQKERKVAQAEAEKKTAVETAQVATDTAIQLANQERAITIADKSRLEAAAAAQAAAARAEAVQAQERVKTVEAVEIADRSKKVALVAAEETARKNSIGTVVAAEAEQEAAANLAKAVRVRAEADRDAATMQAEATRVRGEAEAQALERKNEARNKLAPMIVDLEVKLAMVAMLPGLVAEMVKPMEKIESIRVADLRGLGGGLQVGGAAAGEGSGGGQGGLANQVVTAALSYGVQKPLLEKVLREIGLQGEGAIAGDLDTLMASATQAAGFGKAAVATHDGASSETSSGAFLPG